MAGYVTRLEFDKNASDCFMYSSRQNLVEISLESGNLRYSLGPTACSVWPDYCSGSSWWLSSSYQQPSCWSYPQHLWNSSWSLLWRSPLRTGSSCTAVTTCSFPHTDGWHWLVRIATGSTAAFRCRFAKCTLPLRPVCPEIQKRLHSFINNIFN